MTGMDEWITDKRLNRDIGSERRDVEVIFCLGVG